MKETIDNQILRHLLNGNKLNQWDCIELFKYTRLSATIFNLKARGYVIKEEWIKTPNKKKFKNYWIEQKELHTKPSKETQVQEGFGFEVRKRFEWPD
tara:strand:+ start:157 stop:447 length:291 start_codon:yes stop_codon:yes gene_type:complete